MAKQRKEKATQTQVTETKPINIQDTMKMKIYDASTIKGSPKGKCNISFGKNGLITISRTAMKELGFAPGDNVIIAEDEENPGDWFIGKHESGVTIRKAYDKREDVIRGIFNHSKVCSRIIESVGAEGSISLRVSASKNTIDGVEFYPILTSSYKPKQK